MQDNELDKLINDAASQHHPAYDDKAWDKMAVLLDKHLPEKKDRRKPFVFWLLFVLLLGGGVLLGTLQPWKTDKPVAAVEKKGADNNTVLLQPQNNGSANDFAKTDNNTPGDKTATSSNAIVSGSNTDNITQQNIPSDNVTLNRNIINNKGSLKVKIRKPGIASDDNYSNNNNEIDVNPATNKKLGGKTKTKITAASTAEETAEIIEQPVMAAKPQDAPEQKTEAAIVDKDKEKQETQQKDKQVTTKPETAAVAPEKQKASRKFTDNFAITVSGGADMSFIELNNPGKVKFLYGAGAAYSIGKHFKISSGFYVSKKVYEAKPYQYKFPGGTSYPYLSGIDANCNVYEIPLSVYYGFAAKKQHSWFAGTGLSSLLMKKERYDYNYLTPSGQIYSYGKTVTNENKHYFSVITLSGGYQYKLSDRVALAAEPYTKIPFSGIGAGKIKLNSSGILLSAVIKPFAHTKK